MKRKLFRWLSGDMNFLDYGGTWYRKVEAGRFHVISLTNMDEACGRDNEGHEKYVVELSEVDFFSLPDSTMDSAIKSCGVEELDEAKGDVKDLMVLEACHSYGARAPLGSWSGNNANKLLKEARAESRSLDDPERYKKAMSRPVNAIGSTAKEYMQGDIDAAVFRGVKKDDPHAKLIAKIEGYDVEKVKTFQPSSGAFVGRFDLKYIERQKISSDPIAFVGGYMDGLRAAEFPARRETLAPEYTKGYTIGLDVKVGNKPKPEWHK